MLTNSETAKRVSELMLDIFRRVDESVVMVKDTCPKDEAAAYLKARRAGSWRSGDGCLGATVREESR